MYANLIAQLNAKKITNTALANLLSKTPNTISQKLRGESDFTITEGLTVARTYFPEFDPAYLFEQADANNEKQ